MSERLINRDLIGVEVRRAVRNWPEDMQDITDGHLGMNRKE